jgi:hypothetical protein
VARGLRDANCLDLTVPISKSGSPDIGIGIHGIGRDTVNDGSG